MSLILSLLEQYKDIDANWLLTGIRSSRSSARTGQEEGMEQDLFSILSEKNEGTTSNPVINVQKNDIIIPQNSIQPKKIEKIITLYSDKSFSEYLPE